jgi:hypothetical protein
MNRFGEGIEDEEKCDRCAVALFIGERNARGSTTPLDSIGRDESRSHACDNL